MFRGSLDGRFAARANCLAAGMGNELPTPHEPVLDVFVFFTPAPGLAALRGFIAAAFEARDIAGKNVYTLNAPP